MYFYADENEVEHSHSLNSCSVCLEQVSSPILGIRCISKPDSIVSAAGELMFHLKPYPNADIYLNLKPTFSFLIRAGVLEPL